MNRQQARLALKVCNYLDAHPEKHDQGFWWVTGGGKMTGLAAPAREGCGTVGCLAGWTVYHSRAKLKRRESIARAAQRLLGLTDSEVGFFFHGYENEDKIRKELRLKAEAVLAL